MRLRGARCGAVWMRRSRAGSNRGAAFLQRLRRAVAWVNVHRATYLRALCERQNERARAVLTAKGGRTVW